MSNGANTQNSRPKLKAPRGACDTHMHIYGPPEQFPFVPGPAAKPAPTPLKDYLAMLDRIGVERAVIVQPAAYGTDNRCTLEAMREMGERARGIATLDTDVKDAELQQLTNAGVRGVRFHMLPGGVLPWAILEEMAARVYPFGWHVQLQMDGRELPDRAAMLRRLPCKLVIDHTGKFLEPVGTGHPGFRALLGLVEGGHCWVKLSAPYETSKAGPPNYPDVGVLAKALVKVAPERMLWGSNWPHPSVRDKPDDAMLLDVLLDWVGDDATRDRILSDNPAALYGF
ncbi:MAG: amidohydrolase family protein [Nitrospiraceae bacterium]